MVICNFYKILALNLSTFLAKTLRIYEGKIEGRIEARGRRGRRRKQLLYDIKKMRGYWKLKEEALDPTLW
jgi:hypothetical protein